MVFMNVIASTLLATTEKRKTEQKHGIIEIAYFRTHSVNVLLNVKLILSCIQFNARSEQ